MKQTKKSFLRRLRWALFLSLPPHEAGAVVEDYSGFFDDRAAEGRSEEAVCREFGPARTVAGTILRESGQRTEPAALLILPWMALTGLLSWWWTWQGLRFETLGYHPFYFTGLLLIPAAWLCWRGKLSGQAAPLPHSAGWHAASWAAPTAVWAVFYGWALWCFLYFLPRWQALPAEEQAAGSHIGQAIGTMKMLCSAALLVLLLLLLLRTWWEGGPRYLPGAAWCVGCLCSISRLCAELTRMDLSESPTTIAVLLPPVIVLAGVGLGGAALTALLIRRGETHGRTA